MMLSPYFWIAMLASALALSSVSYYYGGKHARDAQKAGQFVALNTAVSKAIEAAKKMEENIAAYETTRQKVRIVYRTVKEKADDNIAQNPGYADCGLDADGLRLYNARPAFAEPGAGIPDGPVPGPATGAGRETLDNPEERHREG